MKYIITEDQLNKVKDKILKLRFDLFDDNWDDLQSFLKKRGNPVLKQVSKKSVATLCPSFINIENNYLFSNSSKQ
jgi:hypothetical protein